MAKMSMNELTTYRWSFEQDVHNYVQAGIPAIGVWRQKLSDFGEEKGLELLQESRLEVSSLLWAGGFTGSEGRSHKESIEDAGEAIRLAQVLKAGCLVLYSGARGGHTHNHARRLLRGALDQLLPLAESLGVTLGIEPMHAACAAEWTFLTNLDETVELIDSIGSASLKLVFDVYHFGYDPQVFERLSDLAQRIAIVQLGDSKEPPHGEQDRCLLGEGIIPLERLFGSLSEGGYDGFYDIELMGEEIEASDYHELLARSKQTFNEMVSASHPS